MVQHSRYLRGVRRSTCERVVPIPIGVTFEQAAAALLQGMTAHYLSHSAYPIQPGDEVLIHAGAGGTGLLLTQLAKTRGGRVLTTVSNEEKAELSYQAGADDVVSYTRSVFGDEVKRLTEFRHAFAGLICLLYESETVCSAMAYSGPDLCLPTTI